MDGETSVQYVQSLGNGGEKTLMLNLERIEQWIDEWIGDAFELVDLSLESTMMLIRRYEKLKGCKPWNAMPYSKHMPALWPLFELEVEKIDLCGWDCLSGRAKCLTTSFIYTHASKFNMHELHDEYTNGNISTFNFALAYHRSGGCLFEDKKVVVSNRCNRFAMPADDRVIGLLRSWRGINRTDPLDEYICPTKTW